MLYVLFVVGGCKSYTLGLGLGLGLADKLSSAPLQKLTPLKLRPYGAIQIAYAYYYYYYYYYTALLHVSIRNDNRILMSKNLR